jgi:26-hydroxylase
MEKQFLNTHDSIFSSRPRTTVGKYIFYNSQDVAFAQYGDHWRQMRKICVSELLNAKRIESFKHVREEEMSLTIRSIWEESERGTIAVNLSKASSTLVSNIVWRMLRRRKFSNDDLSANGQGFKDLTAEVSNVAFNIGDFIPYLDWLDLQGIKRRMKEASKTFDSLLEKILDDHVHHRIAATDGREEAEPVKDFVDVLLDMAAETDMAAENKITREKMKAIVLVMYVGGVGTTVNTLEWAVSELLRHPNVMKRLQEEIEWIVGKHRKLNETDLASMKYLHCVVKETLRLYPGAPLGLPHESVEAVTVGGYYLPKETMLIFNLWAIGRDPNVWGTDSSEFKPERFMQEESVDLTGGPSDFRMLTFGGGRRGCPGSLTAISMIELALAHLLHVFYWKVAGDPSEVDMKEARSAALARQVPLFAFPTLRMPNCL